MNSKPKTNNKAALFLKNNAVILIVAIIIAFVLWGFVLANQNPDRTKTVSGVKVTFEGEADLIARSLVIVGDRATVLPEISVQISTDLLHYTELSSSNITATVSLRSITGEGSHTIDIRATTTNGSVLRITPSSVTIQVDKLTTKRIPIQVEYEGVLSSNYWHDEPVLSKTDVEISGAYSILSSITSAICKVPLSSRTESFSNSISLNLLDSNGFLVNSNLLYGDLPSVTVAVTIFPKKTVTIDVLGSLIGTDSLKNNYEVYEVFTVPKNFTIIGEKSVLDGISSLSLERWDITGSSKNLERELRIEVPEGVTLLGEVTSVIVYVNIREKIIEKTFDSIPITVRNLGSGLDYRLTKTAAMITISGRISIINRIQRGDITLYIDLNGLGSDNTHTIPIQVDFGSDSLLDEITFTLDNPNATIIITRK